MVNEGNYEHEMETIVYGDVPQPGMFVRNRQGIVGFAIGAGFGGLLGLGAWFMERAKRKALLNDIKKALAAIDKSAKTDEPLIWKNVWGKEIQVQTGPFRVVSVADLQLQIMNNMVSGRIKGKERDEWKDVLSHLSHTVQRVFSDDFIKRRVAQDGSQEPGGAH